MEIVGQQTFLDFFYKYLTKGKVSIQDPQETPYSHHKRNLFSPEEQKIGYKRQTQTVEHKGEEEVSKRKGTGTFVPEGEKTASG